MWQQNPRFLTTRLRKKNLGALRAPRLGAMEAGEYTNPQDPRSARGLVPTPQLNIGWYHHVKSELRLNRLSEATDLEKGDWIF